jgi:hypothetical protein
MLSLSQPSTYHHQLHQPYNYSAASRNSNSPRQAPTFTFSSATTTAATTNNLPAVENATNLIPDTLPFDTSYMQSEAWGGVAQYAAPRKLGHGRIAHQRESSLSSLGSAGPASPFAQSTSNPQIAVTDSGPDGLSDMHSHDGNDQGYYQLAKTVNGSFPGYHNLDQALPEMAYPLTIPGPNHSKPRADRGGLLPAPELSGSASRSHPTSVASSIAGDSPATPTVGDVDVVEKRRKGESSLPPYSLFNDGSSISPDGFSNIPKLDRTMTDIYGDELYNPNFAITSTPPQQSHMTATSSANDVFSQRLNAANIQHLSAAHSPTPTVSRDRSSPFRMGSPHALSQQHDFGVASGNGMQFNSAQRMREQTKAQQDAQMFQQQMTRVGEPETPKTISPKDAILEFTEPEGDANFPLFGQEPTGFDMDQIAKVMVSQEVKPQMAHLDQAGAGGQHFPYLSAQMPSSIQMPQQYPFVARTQSRNDSPPRLSSAGSSSGGNTPAHYGRPMGTGADGGTYTCTYHGCTLRFETPALLQKHKREGHRQTHGLANAARPASDMGMTSSLLNSQAGPHRCDRINPSTGKPCSTVFSRPYDLTRHEDTIHNARKQKVRCDLCTEEKTFSRADALTRHYRVCHPDMELPGKHRRRGGV